MALAVKGYPQRPSAGGAKPGGAFGDGRKPYRPPKPANDNAPRPPKPVNDNLPPNPRGRSGVPTVRGLKGGRLPVDQLVRLYQWYQTTPGNRTTQDYNLGGWVLQCGTGEGPYTAQVGGCPLAATLVESIYWDIGPSYNPGNRTYTINFYSTKGPAVNIGTNRWSHWGNRVAVYTRTEAAGHIPFTIPAVIVPAKPMWNWTAPGGIPWMPSINPWAPGVIPIGQPVPAPAPVPVRHVPRVLPRVDPAGNPIRGPYTAPRTLPDPRFARNPGPTFRWTYNPGRRTQPPPTKVQPVFVPAKPPGPNEKQKKKVLSINGTVTRVFGNMTEVIDFIDAMYDALHPNAQSKRPKKFVGWDEKAWRLWKYSDQINYRKAFKNLVMNELEDRVIGKLGQGAAKLSAKHGRPVGLQTGPAL